MKPFRSDIDLLPKDPWELQTVFLKTPELDDIKKAFEELDKHPFRPSFSQIHHCDDGMTYFTDDNLVVRMSMPTEDYDQAKARKGP